MQGNFTWLYEALSVEGIDPTLQEERLTEITRAYPYFAAAHFAQLAATNGEDEQLSQRAVHTNLLFNNPLWLQYQLQQLLQPTTVTTEVYLNNRSVDTYVESSATPGVDTKLDAVEAPATNEEELATPVAELIQPEPITMESLIETSHAGEPVPEEVEQPIITTESITATANEALAMQSAISDTLSHQLPDLSTPNSTELLFEPLHTTDYFASQGIRLSDDLKPTDRLGKQLKSFTEWLKTMKKVHPANGELNTSAEAHVSSIAEKSNVDGDVVTEAMAEVLLQQGKTTKAKEVYQKLSLLNPAKSAFFAAKLEEIG